MTHDVVLRARQHLNSPMECTEAWIGALRRERLVPGVRVLSEHDDLTEARQAESRAIMANPSCLNAQVGCGKSASRLDDAVGAVERETIFAALRETKGNRKAAAELLGISRPTLLSRIRHYEEVEAKKLAADGNKFAGVK